MDRWNNRFLLVLAVAGGAIGIGNFLRFPTLFAQYGGLFLIPYLISFFIIGLPLMFTEWILGAMARDVKMNSLASFLEVYHNNRVLKYFGVAALSACLIISGYYIYIESWILGYGWISVTGGFKHIEASAMGDFLGSYMTLGDGVCDILCILCLLITIFLNYYFTAKGIAKGIATLIKVSMPLLIVIALFMLANIFYIPGTWAGIKYMFEPRVDLWNSKMWVDAASQMFFSLSVGFTATFTYVTYADKNLDIAKQGLMASFMNVGMEVLIASFIAIPVSYVAFGADKIQEVVKGSSIAFGMVSMPSIFNNVPGGQFWSFLWFFLLFIAALTSSLSIVQPSASFICNKFKTNKLWGSVASFVISLIILVPSVLCAVGIDEFDFWANSFIVPIGSLLLIVIVYSIGKEKCWVCFENNSSSKLNWFMKFCISWATPLFLIIVITLYIFNYGREIITCSNYEPEKIPQVILCRALMVVIILIYALIIHFKKIKKPEE